MHQNNETSQIGEDTIPTTPHENTQTTTDTEEENKELLKETQKYAVFETFIIAGIVALAVAASFYLYSNNILRIPTEDQLLVYMFSMIIAPSAFFLLILHIYSLYKGITTEKRPILLPLDIFYFSYVTIAGIIMFSLFTFLHKYQISITFLSPGWTAGAMLLCVEVAFVFFISRWIVTTFFYDVFPHLIILPATSSAKKIQKKPAVVKPTPQIYYVKHHPPNGPLKSKPNHSLWQDHPSFVKYEHSKNDHHHPIP